MHDTVTQTSLVVDTCVKNPSGDEKRVNGFSMKKLLLLHNEY
jgi:hypothetical protein